MNPKMLTTGQAARMCSVTPDTILKWIQSGRLPASRTLGGHHRIDQRDIELLLKPAAQGVEKHEKSNGARQFRYCWEYNGNGSLLPGCRHCAVYEMRALRCYQVAKLAPDANHTKLFCSESCEECEYYNLVRTRATNVLMVTDDPSLTEKLKSEAESAPFNLEFSTCEYECSFIIERFRPDFAVVDCSLGIDRSRDISSHLAQDPRTLFSRVILAANEGEFPNECDKMVFARIVKPLSIDDIAECIADFQDGDELG